METGKQKVIKETPFANAAALIMAVFYALCVLITLLFPDLLIWISKTWAHSLNLEAIKSTEGLNFVDVLLGLVTSTGLTWVSVYYFAVLYNRLAKRG